MARSFGGSRLGISVLVVLVGLWLYARREEKGHKVRCRVSPRPLEGVSPVPKKFPLRWSRLLKVPPASSNTKLRTKPLTHGSVGTGQI